MTGTSVWRVCGASVLGGRLQALNVLSQDVSHRFNPDCQNEGRLRSFALSHNFKFDFRPYDKGLLPVSWRARTIEIGMDGQQMKLDFFGYVETWELFREYEQLVHDRLT